jgi:hypothetical protein
VRWISNEMSLLFIVFYVKMAFILRGPIFLKITVHSRVSSCCIICHAIHGVVNRWIG